LKTPRYLFRAELNLNVEVHLVVQGVAKVSLLERFQIKGLIIKRNLADLNDTYAVELELLSRQSQTQLTVIVY
jgi:hypothetical protein